MDHERLEVLLEQNNLNLDKIIIASQELTETIEAEWDRLGSLSDAELVIKDAFHTLCNRPFEDLDPSVVSLAYKLGQWSTNGYNDIEETLELLKHDERFEEAVDWFNEFIGYDIAVSLRLYITVNSQVD